MIRKRLEGLVFWRLVAVAFVAALSLQSQATVREGVLYAFPQDGSTGNYPEGGEVSDKAGNLYGTTAFGGLNLVSCPSPSGCGTVYELSPPAEQGGAWTETVLYEFQGGTDGDRPECTLVIDNNGNLYGTSVYGVAPNDGAVVWELSPPAPPGGTWSFTTLYVIPGVTFSGTGFNAGNLLMDKAGNLYGTTFNGGTGCVGYGGCGTVYEVSPPSQPGGAWTGTVIYNFPGGSEGQSPSPTLIMDGKGALYGGAYGGTYALVFKLEPPSEPGGPWTENAIFNFSQIGGFFGLASDGKGNLYGASTYGPDQRCQNHQGCGYVFELSRARPGGTWSETVLYTFSGGSDGWYPTAVPILDGHGKLYGTTYMGGVRNGGTVFSLSPPQEPGGPWTKRRFALGHGGSDLVNPTGRLIFGPGRAITGTATGTFSGGGVFSISVTP